ncbi:hypothetical protein ACFO3J_20650 [Streptomyces polygonati]|uniref:Uncharacterized protein n=1 Tax=Streptomyces polygonati TaxID=1617087 RepID=A0ABV8HVG0_9ACTN
MDVRSLQRQTAASPIGRQTLGVPAEKLAEDRVACVTSNSSLTLYPGSGRGGVAEVVFAHMANREPFVDRARRMELLNRLNEMECVSLPEGKLELRPSFRLSVLEDDTNRERLYATLSWFRDCWEARNLV